ncbi:rhamnan synthesis F family protein (plasmid) [Rhizobium sp. CB3171]|uniref:rhamnan synthesis F family protein n=1 Tax=Rhizobium sp. CB3171 TaxID=3039157 RepID=UPI0024B20CA2|nr:rhamnan synthesis F family protein [Rhizobium sp. CB3171]WFU05943.1 rhamnan synthesis F family protein [Rhizobium sp. CB3171]
MLFQLAKLGRKKARFLLQKWNNRRDSEILVASELFDEAWYLKQYPDVAATGVKPAFHYLMHGANEGRDPNPLFNTKWYLTNYPDVEIRGMNPLVHYITCGAEEGRDPNPVFDTKWYTMTNPEISNGINPLLHYKTHGIGKELNPNLLFDAAWYRSQFPEVAGTNSLSHYLQFEESERPATYDSEAIISGIRVAVVAHLFYEDLWDEIVSYLGNIPTTFDLYVTIPERTRTDWRKLILSKFPNATILEVANAGRDIGPFLSLLPLLLTKNYTAICKIHTKKGQTEPATWRRLMLEGLLGSEFLVTRVLCSFKADPDLLLVGAEDLYVSGPTHMMDNQIKLEYLLQQLYPGRTLPREWGFFAGTMFWISPRALEKLSQIFFDGLVFEVEDGTNDGQIAHAIERFFGLIATMENGNVGMTELRGQGPWGTKVKIDAAPGKPALESLTALLQMRAAGQRTRTAQQHRAVAIVPPQPLRRWSKPAAHNNGINLVGPVGFINGVSISARGYASCIMKAGIALNVIPWSQGFERLRSTPVQYPSIDKQIINLVHLNLDLLTIAGFLDKSPLDEIVVPSRYNIVIIYWELSALLPEWHAVLHRFDEIWCASTFMARSVSAVTKRPVRVVRPMLEREKVALTRTRRDFGLSEDRYVFFYAADAGSILGRKNPKALIDAYIEEFGPDDGACCLLKIHYSNVESPEIREILSIAEQRPDVIFMDRLLEDGEMHDLFQLIDCYVSPHRSEGLGLTILEAMDAGKPVIATPYGGAADFVTSESAWPLDYKLTEVGNGNEPYPAQYLWADPSIGSLRQAMRALFSDRKLTEELGRKGRIYAHDLFSAETTTETIRREVDRILQAGGSGDDKAALRAHKVV